MVAAAYRSARTAVVITALELEAEAVRAHLADVDEDIHENGTVYLVGRFGDETNAWRVAIVIAGQGNPAAAMEMERASRHFRPEVVLFVGIAGALKDLALGDVVAADKVYGYERGKAEAEFRTRVDVRGSTYPAIQRARSEVLSNCWQSRIMGQRPPSPPRAVVAPIAAGEKVVAAHGSSVFQFLRTQFGDAVAVEMEGVGFLTAAHGNPGVDALVVRGISDLVEGKSTADAAGSQTRAANHAAAFAFEFLATFGRDSAHARRELNSRAEQLERLRLESRARCIERWQGAGVSADVAALFADDQSVGLVDGDLRPSANRPMVILVGEFGIGKSLTCERLYQQALAIAAADPTAPVPVYVERFPGKLPSVGELRSLAASIGDIDETGIALFLERSDEGGQEHAVDCLAFGRRVIATWPKRSTVVMPSRPLPQISDAPEAITLPLMPPAEAARLVSRVSDMPFDENRLWTWAGTFHDALRRPLFAILVGLYLRTNRTELGYPSIGELISEVVLQALRRWRIDGAGATQRLQRLAVATIDRGGEPVHYSVIGSLLEVDALHRTGLVLRRGELIGFAVPIVAQWFAAQALTGGQVDIANIVSDRLRASAWRYPLSVLAASAPEEAVHQVMRVLASKDPALAAVVIKDGVGDAFRTRAGSARGAGAIGTEHFQDAWDSWSTGLGPLRQAAGAVDWTGANYTLSARQDDAGLIVEWFSTGQDGTRAQLASQTLYGANENSTPASPWQRTHNILKSNLRDSLRKLRLPIDDDDPLGVEAVWAGSLALTQQGSLHRGPLRLSDIAEALEKIPMRSGVVHSYDRGEVPVSLIAGAVERLTASGTTEMHAPWPTANIAGRSGGWVWSPYTDEQLLARTRAVYGLAIAGYLFLVERWFSNFADRLGHAIILPARFVATLDVPAKSNQDHKYPGLHYRFEPLPIGNVSRVEITLAAGKTRAADFHEYWSTIQKMRADSGKWISSGSGSTLLEVFSACPATKLAFRWLEDDLRDVHWV